LSVSFWILCLSICDGEYTKKDTDNCYYRINYHRSRYKIIVGIVLCGVFRDGQIVPRRDSALVTAVFVPGYVSLPRVVKRWNQLVSTSQGIHMNMNLSLLPNLNQLSRTVR
jgi:hypothetical protein